HPGAQRPCERIGEEKEIKESGVAVPSGSRRESSAGPAGCRATLRNAPEGGARIRGVLMCPRNGGDRSHVSGSRLRNAEPLRLVPSSSPPLSVAGPEGVQQLRKELLVVSVNVASREVDDITTFR